MDPFGPISQIMQKHDVRCSVQEFHALVNVTFHRFESEVYDEEHLDMWESLPPQFALLADDCLGTVPARPGKVSLLDIGCGTGLASDSLLKSKFRERIGEVHLLDTSPAMLQRVSQRAAGWGIPSTCLEGTVETLVSRNQYGLIAACSVLHHVPDLEVFLHAVRGLQSDQGIFLHAQDPNGDFLNDRELLQRTAEASARRLPDWACRLAPHRAFGRIYRELTGKQGMDYISKTKRELVRLGVVSKSLSTAEIYAITDIHVQNGQGISVERMKRWLPDYELVTRRSYGYYGILESSLPRRLKLAERELAASGAPQGQWISAAWGLKSAVLRPT